MKTLKEIAKSPALWVTAAAWGLGMFLFNIGTTLPPWGSVLAAFGVVVVAWLFVGWLFRDVV